MFSLAILSATPMEIEGIVKELKAIERPSKNHILKTFSAALNRREILIASLGMGILRFSLGLGLLLNTFNFKEAILVGSAGAFESSSLKIGDVAVAELESLWEAREQEHILHLLPQLHMAPQSSTYGNDLKGFFINNAIPLVPMLTVINPARNLEESRNRYLESKAECENMEGYAFYLFLNSMGLKGVELRAISNIAGERDKSKWKMSKAMESIKNVLISMIEEGVHA